MRRYRRTIMACVVPGVLAFAPRAVDAQSVGGRVVEEGTLQPVAFAGVALVDSAGETVIGVTADSLGSFFVRADAGEYRLRAQRIGYETVTSERIELRDDEPIIVELRMSARGIPLEPLIVRARGIERGEDAFRRRRDLGEGVFLTQDSIALRQPRFAWDVFRGVDGIMLRSSGDGAVVYSFSGGRCMAIYVDNNARPLGWYNPNRSRSALFRSRPSAGAASARTATGFGHIVANSLRGVEVYRNFREIPEELRTASRVEALWPEDVLLPCGMAIIWTKVAW